MSSATASRYYTNGQSNSYNGTAFTTEPGASPVCRISSTTVMPELDFYNISSLNADRLSSLNQVAHNFVYTDNLSATSRGRHSICASASDISTRLRPLPPLGFNGSDNYGTFQYNTSATAPASSPALTLPTFCLEPALPDLLRRRPGR